MHVTSIEKAFQTYQYWYVSYSLTESWNWWPWHMFWKHINPLKLPLLIYSDDCVRITWPKIRVDDTLHFRNAVATACTLDLLFLQVKPPFKRKSNRNNFLYMQHFHPNVTQLCVLHLDVTTTWKIMQLNCNFWVSIPACQKTIATSKCSNSYQILHY